MMGDPVSTLLVLGLQGASVASQSLGRRAVKREQNDLVGAENIRQKRYGDQSRALVDQLNTGFTPEAQTGKRDVIEGEWTRALEPIATAPTAYAATPTTPSGPVEVKTEAARQMSRALRSAKDRVLTTAKLGAYGQNQQGNAFDINRAGQDLSRLGGFSQGSQSVLDSELAGAYDKAAPYSLFSDVAGGLGDLYAGYHMSGTAPKREPKLPKLDALQRLRK